MGTEQKGIDMRRGTFQTKIGGFAGIKEASDRIGSALEMTGHVQRRDNSSSNPRGIPTGDGYIWCINSDISNWQVQETAAGRKVTGVISNNEQGSIGNRTKIVKSFATVCGAGHGTAIDMRLKAG
jgi:hypothetical protein